MGSIPLLFGFIFWLLNDNQTDIPPELIMSVGGVGVAIGAVLGGASYLLWQRPNARECLIRHVAASQLFPAADPAQINRSLATDWADELDAMLLDNGITDYRDASRRPHEFSLITRQLLLLRLRCHVALAEPDPIIDGQIEALLRDLATQKH